MKPERWQQAGNLYHAALELLPEERTSFLDGACGSDQALRQEVESLLAAKCEAGDFLAAGALTDAAKILAGEQDVSLVGKTLARHAREVFLAHLTLLLPCESEPQLETASE